VIDGVGMDGEKVAAVCETFGPEVGRYGLLDREFIVWVSVSGVEGV